MGWLRRGSLALAGFGPREKGDCHRPTPELRTNRKIGSRKEISFSGHWLSYSARYFEERKGSKDGVCFFTFSKQSSEILWKI